MRFIRALIVLIQMLIFAFGALVIGLFIIPISSIKRDGIEHRRYCANIVHKSWKHFCNVMCRFGSISIKRIGNFDNIRGKVIVSSHPSLIDIVLLIGTIPNCLCLAKKELLKNPFMHSIVKHLYIINDVELEEFERETKLALDNGFNIIIFPTGTRTLPNEKIKIHKGAAQIALKANADIIPLTIETDFQLLRKNHFPLDAGRKATNFVITRKEDIKISQYKQEELSDIKLRKILSEKIKEEIYPE